MRQNYRFYSRFEIQLRVVDEGTCWEKQKMKKTVEVFSLVKKSYFLLLIFFPLKYLRTSLLTWSSDWTTFDFLAACQPISERRETFFCRHFYAAPLRRLDDPVRRVAEFPLKRSISLSLSYEFFLFSESGFFLDWNSSSSRRCRRQISRCKTLLLFWNR